MVSLAEKDLVNVRLCLQHLSDAQALINQAASALCSVPGFGDEWSALTEAHDVVRKHWYHVENRRRVLTS